MYGELERKIPPGSQSTICSWARNEVRTYAESSFHRKSGKNDRGLEKPEDTTSLAPGTEQTKPLSSTDQQVEISDSLTAMGFNFREKDFAKQINRGKMTTRRVFQ